MIAFFIIGAGTVAHWYKRRNQFRYGLVEIVFGSSSAFAIALGMDSSLDFAKWASLVGAGYVIARGLGNRYDAIHKLAKAACGSGCPEAASQTPPATPDALTSTHEQLIP